MGGLVGEAEGQLLARLNAEVAAHMLVVGMGGDFTAQYQTIRPGHGSQDQGLALFNPGHAVPVVKAHHQVHLEGHLTFEPFDHPHHGVVIGQWHAVGDPGSTAGGDEGGLQNQRVLQVLPADLRHRLAGRQAPATVFLIAEQGCEHRRRIEPGQAQPVQCAVTPHQGGATAVSDQCVVFDQAGHRPSSCVCQPMLCQTLRSRASNSSAAAGPSSPAA
ncbi:hypothetical protein D3C77_438990 [compost metagenome]